MLVKAAYLGDLWFLFRYESVTSSCHGYQPRPWRRLAEGVGFEPTVAFTTPVFKTGLFDHSSTPPMSVRTLEVFVEETEMLKRFILYGSDNLDSN